MVEILLMQGYNKYIIYSSRITRKKGGKMKEKRENKAPAEINVEKEIDKYLRKNNISATDVSRKTKVDIKLLTGKPDRKMNATEMLRVCSYLGIQPFELLSINI